MTNHGMLAAAALSLAFSIDLFAIEVGSIADSRFEESGGWTLDGVEMTDTRAKLLNPANFGPEGTHPEAVNITDVADPITYTTLSTFDVFFVGYLADNDEDFITEDEGLAMHNWVSNGGTMIISCDDTSHDAICIAFSLSISSAKAASSPLPMSTSSATTRFPTATESKTTTTASSPT